MSITTIEVAIEDKLKATTAVTALLGQEIFANVADQKSSQSESPYLVIITDGKMDEQSCDGVGISNWVLYTDIYHDDLRTAINIDNAVVAALQDYTGTHGSVFIQEMWQTDKTMARDDETEKHVYRREWSIRGTIS